MFILTIHLYPILQPETLAENTPGTFPEAPTIPVLQKTNTSNPQDIRTRRHAPPQYKDTEDCTPDLLDPQELDISMADSKQKVSIQASRKGIPAHQLNFAEHAKLDKMREVGQGTVKYDIRSKALSSQAIHVELPMGICGMPVQCAYNEKDRKMKKPYTYLRLCDDHCEAMSTTRDQIHQALKKFEDDCIHHLETTDALPAKMKRMSPQRHSIVKMDTGYGESLGFNFYALFIDPVTRQRRAQEVQLDPLAHMSPEDAVKNGFINVEAQMNNTVYPYIKRLYAGAKVQLLLQPSAVWTGPLGIGIVWSPRAAYIEENVPVIRCAHFSGQNSQAILSVADATATMPGEDGPADEPESDRDGADPADPTHPPSTFSSSHIIPPPEDDWADDYVPPKMEDMDAPPAAKRLKVA